MLKEEKWMFRCIGALSVKENHKVLRKAFREAVKAVREAARGRVVRCIDDNFVDLPDEWHRGYNKALRDARDWAGSDYDPALRRK